MDAEEDARVDLVYNMAMQVAEFERPDSWWYKTVELRDQNLSLFLESLPNAIMMTALRGPTFEARMSAMRSWARAYPEMHAHLLFTLLHHVFKRGEWSAVPSLRSHNLLYGIAVESMMEARAERLEYFVRAVWLPFLGEDLSLAEFLARYFRCMGADDDVCHNVHLDLGFLPRNVRGSQGPYFHLEADLFPRGC